MFVEFEQLPLASRVWVYQANRKISAGESNKIAYTLKESIENWQAHGAPLTASFKIEHDRFVIIGLDESKNLPTGCSIDTSTHWLKAIGQELNIDFFDRSLALLKDNEVHTVSIFGMKKAVEEGVIQRDTEIFNNNITRLPELISKRRVLAADYPFTKKYFQEVEA